MPVVRDLWAGLAWPPFIVLVIFAIASDAFPNRYLLFPQGLSQFAAIAVYVLIAVSFVAHAVPAFRKFERPAAFIVTSLASACAAAYFFTIIGLIATNGSAIKGGLLLQAAILVWIITILSFSLWYWLIDDGNAFFFPQYESDRYPGWKPNYVDYLFLSFTTSTAFSPTDVAPAARSAKMLMLIQSALSLAIVAIAAARAINVL